MATVHAPDRRPVPEAESSEPREVFTFFGFASYFAQVQEREVLLHAAFLRQACRSQRCEAWASRLLKDPDAMTFGGLLREARDYVNLPSETERLARTALAAKGTRSCSMSIASDWP